MICMFTCEIPQILFGGCVSWGFSRETEPMGDIQKRLMIGIGSHNYGGLEVPQPTLCKLKNKETQWCNSV